MINRDQKTHCQRRKKKCISSPCSCKCARECAYLYRYRRLCTTRVRREFSPDVCVHIVCSISFMRPTLPSYGQRYLDTPNPSQVPIRHVIIMHYNTYYTIEISSARSHYISYRSFDRTAPRRPADVAHCGKWSDSYFLMYRYITLYSHITWPGIPDVPPYRNIIIAEICAGVRFYYA